MARLMDDIIEEIHTTRQEHAARFAHDMGRIVDDLQAGGKACCRGLATNQGTDCPAHASRLSIAAFPLRPTAALKV
jgi:hypothetical protein